MATVFVVNKGCHDYKDAERFGKIEYLSKGMVNRYAVGTIYRIFWPKLKVSKEDDFILITGLSIMTAIACGIFGSLHNRLNLLLYKTSKKGKGEYINRTIFVNGERRQAKAQGHSLLPDERN